MSKPYITAFRNLTKKPNINMFKMHTHDDYEIFCFLKGSAKYYVEGKVYNLNPEDILIMKRAEAHSLIIDKPLPYERICINFNSDAIIGNLSSKIIDFLDNRPLGNNNKYSYIKSANLIYFLNRICETNDFSEQQLYLTFILNELRMNKPTENDINIDGIHDIINFINNNIFEDINLDRISAEFFISKNHLNRKFKKYTGSTIWSYIITKRLIFAKKSLISGEKPTSIYYKCGFKDYCSFYRAYKNKYGISPNDVFVK